MNKRLSVLVLAAMTAELLAGCGSSGVIAPLFPTNTPNPVGIESTQPPTPEWAARSYLEAWKAGDFPAMYALLTPLSRDAFSPEEFADYYTRIQNEATLQTLEYEIESVNVGVDQAEVVFRETWRTILVGEIRRQVMMQLKLQNGVWRIAWDDGMVLPELKGGNTLLMVRQSVPRGDIYDRNELALASQAQVVTIGIVPGRLEDEGAVVARLRDMLGLTSDQIRAKFANAQPDWYVPIAILSQEDMSYNYQVLKSLPGVVLVETSTRYYHAGGAAAHVVGYIGQPSAEELPYYRSLGYGGDEKVGKSGIEAWGEQYLSGKPKATLMVYSPTGNAVATLASSDSVPAMDIHTTLDRRLQSQIERYVFGPLTGAAVVIKRDTGEVLAMASNPDFDNNLFNTDNYNTASGIAAIFADDRTPLLNRAAQGQYPLGSVFKIITMSAGLESGMFTPLSTYNCEGHFYDSTGHQYDDWTVERQTKPHGKITLTDGLIQSCNVFFWHIGYELYWNEDRMRVPNTARGFGLGKPTGIQAIAEESGFVPDPAWKVEALGAEWTDGDALNQAIGQGLLQVTPLQVADYVAAVGNGGTLYRPQLIRSIETYNDDVVFSMQPEVRGRLPVTAENLAAVQEAMKGVIYHVKGTAMKRFIGISDAVRIAGKTGTAQDLPRLPHAWFAAYTYGSNYMNRDDIAVVVIVENIGEGSVYAAPMVRRIMEIYFRSQLGPMYAWEATYGVMGTDTPEVTDTPEFGESPTAAP